MTDLVEIPELPVSLNRIALELRACRLRAERDRLGGTGANKLTKDAAKDRADREARAAWGER